MADQCRTDRTGSDACKALCDANGIQNNPICKYWCENNPVECDNIASDYCKKNTNNVDFCGCYNFTADVKATMDAAKAAGQAIIPWCHIANCASNANAYRSTVMQTSAKCPDQPLCLQSAAANNTAGNVSFKNLNFNCSTDATQNFFVQYQPIIIGAILCFVIMCSSSSLAFLI